MAEIKVKTASGEYSVHIGNQILKEKLTELYPEVLDKVFAAVDSEVWKLHSEHINSVLHEIADNVHLYIIPSGESSKSTEEWVKITAYMLENGIRRNVPLIAIGGGVTGDLAGFAASTVMRGVPLIHVPTTLLAMTDSAVGGKTGINHKSGKNLVGTFYQPECVIADTAFLSTLPQHEWVNGLSEVLKYACISDENLFTLCEQIPKESLKQMPEELLYNIVVSSVHVKADVVTRDEKESGIRAWLNFGHTFAHALEKWTGYGTISHGEAVFIGMLAAIRFSNNMGSVLNPIRILAFHPLYKIEIDKKNISTDTLITNMSSDKKKTSSSLKLVLLKDWQQPYQHETDNNELLIDAWQYALQYIRQN